MERTNKELGRLFRTLIKTKHTEWVSKVNIIQNILNEVHHETTGFTPLEIHLNKKPTRFWEKLFDINKNETTIENKLMLVEQRIRKKGNYRAKLHADKHKFAEYKIDDLVLIKANNISKAESKITAKFLALYEGPYRLKQKVSENPFKLENPNTKEIRGQFHANLFKKWYK